MRDVNAIYTTLLGMLDDGHGPVIRVSELAVAYAKTGAIYAADDVKAATGSVMQRLRRDDIPVVPVTDRFFAYVDAGTPPTDEDELAECVAGIGHAAKTTAFYFPEAGTDDLLFIRHAIQRMVTKDQRHVTHDIETARLSDNGKAKVEAHRPPSTPLLGDAND